MDKVIESIDVLFKDEEKTGKQINHYCTFILNIITIMQYCISIAIIVFFTTIIAFLLQLLYFYCNYCIFIAIIASLLQLLYFYCNYCIFYCNYCIFYCNYCIFYCNYCIFFAIIATKIQQCVNIWCR